VELLTLGSRLRALIDAQQPQKQGVET